MNQLGLGCMGMSGMYGASDDRESVATIQAALDAGISLLDTGDFYGMGHNEMLLAEAIRGRREQAVISVKFGALRTPDGGWTGVDARPVAVKNFLTYTLRRLKVEYIDIYRPARLDASVPIEDTVGAIAEMVAAGYVRQIGLSEMGADTIRRAHAVHPIADLQIEYSLISRSVEEKIVPVLDELGIGMTAYGVLSRGLLSGSKPAGPGDFRTQLPRFAQGNEAVIAALNALAAERGVTATQLAIAWVMAKGPRIVPVVGARKRTQLTEMLGALSVNLTPEEAARLESALPPAQGSRYDGHQMAMLDSER